MDKTTGTYAFMSEFTNISLEQLLQAAGVQISLGVLNPRMDYLKQSVATVAVPSLGIEKGVFYRAKMALIGIRSDVMFKLDPDGVDFTAIIDTSEFSRVR